MKLRKLSIQWKLFIYLAVFLLSIIIVLWLIQTVFLNDFYKITKIQQTKSAAVELTAKLSKKNIIGEYMLGLDDIHEEILSPAAIDAQVSILIIDKFGGVLFGTYISSNSVVYKITPAQLMNIYLEAVSNGGTYLYDDPKPAVNRINSIIHANIFNDSQNNEFALIISSSIVPVNATVSTIRRQLVMMTVIILSGALLLATLLSREISHPMREMSKSAKKLATGDYDVSFETGSFIEISELAAALNYAAKELSKVDTLQKELIANVSHDLRTPLTMISGYAELIRDIPGENNSENAQIIVDEAKRLSLLVRDLLDISQMQAGVQALNLSAFSLTKAIKKILRRYSHLAGSKGYVINFLAEADVIVEADELKITQVIYNLINNAINYSGDNKYILVRQTLRHGKALIEVIDNGEGIKAELINQIWDRYYRAEKGHAREEVGTGLGLSIVKSILQMHSAAYGVESEEGKGSNFWFEIKYLDAFALNDKEHERLE